MTVGTPSRPTRSWPSTVVRVFGSAGLVALAIGLASPAALMRQAPLLPWKQLTAVTVALVCGLYLADSYCVYWLFTQPNRTLRFSSALTARGSSYLLSSINYELGQGAMAWRLAATQGRSFWSALGTCLLLAYHDIGVLLTLGLVGALLSVEPTGPAIARSCAIAMVLIVCLGLAVRLLPGGWQERWLPERWRLRLDWLTWRHSARLALLRTGYFGLMLLYAAVGLRTCGIHLSLQAICSVVPLALLADGLPISISGLGTRETTLLYLINPEEEQRAVLVAFSMLWSLGLIVGRATLGLGFWWLAPSPVEAGSPRLEGSP